ncbi:MAG: zinc dependent phospholipase C family protein [Clostridia bacterium]|nr:zinc dependent phospholipase C family protein [Clostridia bacterium]
MPAFSTHYLFANSLKERIAQADTNLELCVPALYYGTQGPDFMFQHRILPWMKGKCRRNLASKLHHCDPAKLFFYMGEYLNTADCDKNIVKSYIYGFICHFSLDRIAHPYVYSVQKKITPMLGAEDYPGFVVHNRIELNIDALLLEEFLGSRDTRSFHTDKTLLDDERLISEIGKLMGYAAPKVIDDNSGADVYTQGLYDMRYMQSLLSDARPWLRPTLEAIQLPIRPFMGKAGTSFLRPRKPDMLWDWLNNAKSVWYGAAYPDVPRTESFKELFEAAQDDAINIISKFDLAMQGKESFDELTENMDFDSGTRFDIKVQLP